MSKRNLTIAAIAQAGLTFIFLVVALCVKDDTKTAMEAVSLIFTAGTIACTVLCFLNKKVKVDVGVEPIEPTPSAPAEPTPTPTEPVAGQQ